MPDETRASQEPAGEDAASSDLGTAAERYGILSISRRRKDDGRALLLYTHEEPDAA